MNVVECPDCGGKVSPRAATCPHCGCPARYFTNCDVPDELQVGDRLTFGSYKGEQLQWRVLDIHDGIAYIVTTKAQACCSFNKDTGKGNSWPESDLRLWLNEDFKLAAFNEAEIKRIQGEVGCLSIEEARKYFHSNEDRMAYPSDWAKQDMVHVGAIGTCTCWLRSPGNNACFAAGVSVDGSVYADGYFVGSVDIAVRPALRLILEGTE